MSNSEQPLGPYDPASSNSEDMKHLKMKASWNMGISQRIYVLVALGILLFSVGVAVHLLSSDLEEQAREVNQRFLRLVENSRELAILTLQLHDQESRFTNDLKADAGVAFEETLLRAQRLVYSIDNADGLEQVRQKASRVEEALEDLDAHFKDLQNIILAIGLTPEEGVRHKLLQSIEAVESELKLWPLDAVKVKLQASRRFEMSYRLTHDDVELGRFRKAVNELDYAVFATEIPDEQKNILIQKVTDYKNSLTDYATLIDKRTYAQKLFNNHLGKVTSATDQLRDSVIDGIEVTVEQQNALRTRITQILYGAGATALAIFVIVSVGVARSIYRPVRTIDHTMRRLAEGEADLEIPHMDRHDEIGQMARSISIFRETALEAERVRTIEKHQAEEIKLLEIAQVISSELELDTLLHHIIGATTDLLSADRSSLFLYDEKTDELFTKVAQGLEGENGDIVMKEIRIPSTAGLAGECFSTRSSINIPDAQIDPRFNKEVDRQTGYFTRNILCMPISTKDGRGIGVIQALNHDEGPFTNQEENRLRAFAAQVAITLENAKLFQDVLTMKNYNESILKSLSNGVITLDPDRQVVKINMAASNILGIPEDWQGAVSDLFQKDSWIAASVEAVEETGRSDATLDTEITRPDGSATSVNLTTVPLIGYGNTNLGTMLVIEDITGEKRVKATMARYMTKEVMDSLLNAEGESALGGISQEVSILFSDVRSFTTISEALGPRETVSMLNDYFTRMVDVLFHHGGVLDKYIGDAIMAVFGAPLRGEKDADQALLVATNMMRALKVLNRERLDRGEDILRVGIGVGSGEVVAGNLGSPKRMDYTVIGDPVNLAARLEGATKFYGCDVLFCATTQNKLQDHHLIREVDLIRVKGKTRPVAVYEALDHHDEESFPQLERMLPYYHEALNAYRRRQFREARQGFLEACALTPRDKVSQIYSERAEHFLYSPPSDSWDGVWDMKTK